MSQPPNTVLNGPSPENNVPFKDAQQAQEMTKTHQNGDGSSQQFPSFTPRPPLARLDSRSSFPIRPGFPSQQQNLGPRPPQVRQPIPGQQFIQRPPGGTSRPPGQPQFIQNQGIRPPPINQNFRPPNPFPRPQQPSPIRQPGIFQQRSAPTYQQKPSIEGDHLLRSQTLDLTDSLSKSPENVKMAEDSGRSSIDALKTRSYSTDSQNLEEERRRSISSVGSVEEKKLTDEKKSEEYPSRPESRASSGMNRIIEDDDKFEINKTPSPVTDSYQKSVEFKLPKEEIKIKSPSPATKFPDKIDIKIKEKVFQNGLQQKPETKNLELKNLKKTKSPSRSEGDNDSGVDESTQGNDQSSNGDHSSPRKSSGKATSRTSSTTPTKARSLSRGSKSPSLKSPDSTASTPGTAEKKKVPMNKIQVGSAPSPNLKVVRSKIGSLDNASYKPGGGNIKIESKKLDFKNTTSRIEAKNERYTPKGGDKKIQQQKLQWNAKSKIGSLENATHKPKGGDKKIETVKLDFKEKAKPKVGSKDNIKHVPGGGDVKLDEVEEEYNLDIENKKIELKAQSKVGSMDNVKHKPGGGEKKIFDDKEYLKQKSAISSENHSLSGSQNSLPSQPEARGPVADENLNQER